MYLLAPFILQNLKKFLGLIQSYQDVPFSGPKWPICHDMQFSQNGDEPHELSLYTNFRQS